MSGYDDLARLGVTIRPLSQTVPTAGRFSQFSASLGATMQTLAKELRALDAKRIALGLNVRERDIRIDGMLRANASPSSPAVELAFESKFGPLRYATGEFRRWEDNLRAIALSMEALRAVDRYGVSKRGEQYRGWRAIEARSAEPADLIVDVAAARDYLEQWDGDLKRALMETHPDRGGDTDSFRKVMRCKELLA